MYIMLVNTIQVGTEEARRRFSELVNLVHFGGRRVVVTSRGKPKIAMVSFKHIGEDSGLSAEAQRRHQRQSALQELDDNYQELIRETRGHAIDPVETLRQLRDDRYHQLISNLR